MPLKTWTPTTPITSPVTTMTEIDIASLPFQEAYRYLISGILPRPIAFVSTKGKTSGVNLAPFSFFCGVSSNPPCLAFSIARKPDGSKKDTLRNIEETGQFVVNSANEWLAGPVAHCGASYPYGVDEMQKVGLTPLPSKKVSPPSVKESALHFECETYRLVEVGDGSPGSATLVIGRILFCRVSSHMIVKGKIDPMLFAPLARLGGISYAELGNVFEMEIPKI